jgi:hypothetical protein
MKKRHIRVKGYEWQTEAQGYDAAEIRQMCDTIKVDRVTKCMMTVFKESALNVQGYEFKNYLDGTPSFPEVPKDGITADQSAILLIGQAKQNNLVALGMVYTELFVPCIRIFADKPPVKANRVFGVFPQDGKPNFTQLEGGFPNNLYFRMRMIEGYRGPILQRNIEGHTEEFSSEANAIQKVFHQFQRAYDSTPADYSKV